MLEKAQPLQKPTVKPFVAEKGATEPKQAEQDDEYYDYYDEEDDLAKESKDPDKPMLVEQQKDKKGTEETETVKQKALKGEHARRAQEEE